MFYLNRPPMNRFRPRTISNIFQKRTEVDDGQVDGIRLYRPEFDIILLILTAIKLG